MKRKQLTIFLDQTEAKAIEQIRQVFNPAQYRLIKAHITLCREDEIENLEHVLRNLRQLKMRQFELTTRPPQRFWEGKGVFIPIDDSKGLFQKLRARILQNGITSLRTHEAHITLMHPRNSTCDDAKFEAIQKVNIPEQLTIAKISLIEQEMGEVWEVLDEFILG